VKKIAIFASGTGSNARKIIEYFTNHQNIKVALVVSNRKTAPVLRMASENGVDTLVITRQSFYHSKSVLDVLDSYRIDAIILAGFLWLIPPYLVKNFPGRILNIHPALLPKYGGKGMYGSHVHQAVKAANEQESGITIHIVDEEYDKGRIIFQKSCPLEPSDSAEAIGKKVLQLEHRYFAPVIEEYLNIENQNNLKDEVI